MRNEVSTPWRRRRFGGLPRQFGMRRRGHSRAAPFAHRSRLASGRAVTGEEVAADSVQMRAHRARRRFGVASHQGVDDSLVLIAIDLAPLRAERSSLDVAPKVLIADQPQDFVEVIEKFVSRRREDALMQFGVPMLESLDVDSFDGCGMRDRNFVDLADAGVCRGERRGARFENLSHRHHIEGADPSQLLNDVQEIESASGRRNVPLPTSRVTEPSAAILSMALRTVFRATLYSDASSRSFGRRRVSLHSPESIAPTERLLDFCGDQFRHHLYQYEPMLDQLSQARHSVERA